MQEIWKVYNKGADFREIGQQLGLDPVVIRVMRNRDLCTQEEMCRYLGRTAFCGYDGALLKGVKEAVKLLREALLQGRRIRIIGDYDVDGMVSVYVLLRGLQCAQNALGVPNPRLDYAIPHRMRDGYGLNRRLIEQAHEDDVELLLTCDNGIAALAEITLAKQLGMTVIVTDHHEVQGVPPQADVVVDPKQSDCPYPFSEICGAVVAYKLIEQLYQELSVPDCELERFHPYLALATVCDVMPLRDENRYIVRRGLASLRARWEQGVLEPGLAALLASNEREAGQVTAGTLGFVLGPCLNAVGRLSSAVWGMKLLLEEDPGRAAWRAKRLTQMNAIRKELSRRYETEAIAQSNRPEYADDRVLVLYLPGCHESIAGIIAGRVREQTGKPTLIVTDSRQSEVVKGSARSIPEYDMFAALSQQKALFLKYGGHKMAAGFSLLRINLPALRRELNRACVLSEQDIAMKRHIDLVMPVDYVTEGLICQLEQLEPFGNGNARPLFAARNMHLKRARLCGQKQNVLRMTFVTEQGRWVNGVFFSDAPRRLLDSIEENGAQPFAERVLSGARVDVPVSLLYQPQMHEYQGVKSVELRVLGMKYQET